MRRPKGYSEVARRGNQIADDLAGTAAEDHGVPKGKQDCYDWANAVGYLIRRRKCRATMQAMEKRSLDDDGREAAEKAKKEQESQNKKDKDDMGDLIKNSSHLLKYETCRWNCRVIMCGIVMRLWDQQESAEGMAEKEMQTDI